MLVLTRRDGESVILGDNYCKIKVLGRHGNYIRLGILAPDDLSVHREEIFYSIKNNKNKGKSNKSISSAVDKTKANDKTKKVSITYRNKRSEVK